MGMDRVERSPVALCDIEQGADKPPVSHSVQVQEARPNRPSIEMGRVTRDSVDIFSNLVTNLSPDDTFYKALSKWTRFSCKQADLHARKASKLKQVHYLFAFFTLATAGAATVVSGLGSKFAENGDYAYIALSFSAIATVLTGLNAVVDPSGRRREHLNSELQYIVLGRDIATYIVMHPPGREAVVSSKQEILGEFQRRLDNLEAMAPPV